MSDMNRCQGCSHEWEGRYRSHPLTHCIGSDGAPWDDIAACLCPKCLDKTRKFTAVSQFVTFAQVWGGSEEA